MGSLALQSRGRLITVTIKSTMDVEGVIGMGRVTQKDVAAVMGVSVMTVSNAFNRPDQLSEDLRVRVLQRAKKMGYSGPDAVARQLRTGRTNTYAVVFDEDLSYAFSDPFTVLWLRGFSEVMSAHGASITLLSVPASDPASLAAVQDAAVDGLVGLCGDKPAVIKARELGLPTVYCTLSEDLHNDTFVAIDDRAAGRDLGAHLYRLGHRRVTVLAEIPRLSDADHVEWHPGQLADQDDLPPWALDSRSRLFGMLEGLGDADVRIVLTGPNSRDSGRNAGDVVLDRHDRPTAVVGMSDILALGFLDALAQRGLQPGRDVSVAGFDDIGEAAPAGLTTIRQPIAEKGREAARLVLDPRRPNRQIMLPHRLMVRASTAPLL